MNRRSLLALMAAAILTLPSRRGRAAIDETKAQPMLPTEKLTIVSAGGARHDFDIEVAQTMDQQIVGLMFRPHVSETGGMLFDWGTPRVSQMWMKNTLASLDMVFIAEDGTIRHIAENTVPESLAIIGSEVPVRATLELAAGVTRKLDIKVGDKVVGKPFG